MEEKSMADLEKEVKGLKTELALVIRYLSTVRIGKEEPILGPSHWNAFQEDLKKDLKAAGVEIA